MELVRTEARAARAALARLTDAHVDVALEAAVELLEDRAHEILAANALDLDRAEALDEGTLDRLRLDEPRLETIADGLRATRALPPIEREVREWTLPNGLRVAERLVPVGVVGANFEARPNVAVDVASQVLKSGNAVVLRTGAAALETVTALVDRVLRPALGDAAEAVGLVRVPERAGAEALASMPDLVPLVILRGSGASTAALARIAAEHGVRALAHAEGGGVLYAHEAADEEMLERIVRASLDRLGVCNRLNLALADTPDLASVVERVCGELGIAVAGELPPSGEWATEPGRVATITLRRVRGVDDALAAANEETSGLAAAIVTEDAAAAERFIAGYRGTAAFWNAPTRFADGFELLGTPETGISVDRFPGPRGPVTYRDLGLRQYRVVGDGTQRR
ncbi:MAG: gamma-glutamyl phosphate reductase [Acidobacteriota bacterium]|nr:gamma-glutamyl phosphate reductase [Acidobacteriota bacterium]